MKVVQGQVSSELPVNPSALGRGRRRRAKGSMSKAKTGALVSSLFIVCTNKLYSVLCAIRVKTYLYIWDLHTYIDRFERVAEGMGLFQV